MFLAGLMPSPLSGQQITIAKADDRAISNLQVTVNFVTDNKPGSGSLSHGTFNETIVDGLKTSANPLGLERVFSGPPLLIIKNESAAPIRNLRLTIRCTINGSRTTAERVIGDFTNDVSLSFYAYGGRWNGSAWTGNFFRPLDYTASVDPTNVLVEGFEGWGTSLCWWANVVGDYANRNNYADLAFTYLRLNIVRYNIGGGENPQSPGNLEFRARMPGFEPEPGRWDWQADQGQRWMLKAAVARGVDRVDVFANSPPYWMTASSSITGGKDGADNLPAKHELDFAVYLAETLDRLTKYDGIKFNSIAPMNEPSGGWWGYGGLYEGCHMNPDQQARMINLLYAELEKRRLPIGLAAAEESDETSGINSVNHYDPTALAHLSLIVTHTYGANNADKLNRLAASLHKPLGQSEYGDADATGMQTARRIRDDLTGLRPAYWCYWQFVDNAEGWGMIYNPLLQNGSTAFTINEKFYIVGQFSRFIRPGSKILSCADNSSVAGYDPVSQTLTIVTVNDSPAPLTATFDLSAFASVGSSVRRYRTSSNENLKQIKDEAVMDSQFSSTLPAYSVTTHVLSNAVANSRPIRVNDNVIGGGPNQFQYHGTWGYGHQDGAFESDNHWSAVPNNYFQVQFDGSQIKFYGAKTDNCGIAASSIDGGAETLVDQYAPNRRDTVLLWKSPPLPKARHVLNVRVTGTHNAASSDNYVAVDRIDIIAHVGPTP